MTENLRVSYNQLERDVCRRLGNLIYEFYDLELFPEELKHYYSRTSRNATPILNHVVYTGLVLMLTEMTLKDICEDLDLSENSYL